MWYFFWIALSLVVFGLGMLNFFQEQAFLRQAELDTGTITRYELYVRKDGKSEYCPRIEFTDQAGDPVAVQGNDCPNAPDRSKIGTTEQIYYDPKKPSAYEEKTATTGYDGLLGGVGFGVFFGLFWFVPLAIAIVRRLIPSLNRGSARSAGAGAGLSASMRQDAQRYHANQAARERSQPHGPPPQPAPSDPLAAEEARLARLKQQEAELQRKIDERRQQKGQ